MSTEREHCCCQEDPKFKKMCDDADETCITNHPGFSEVALAAHNLKVVYYEYRQMYGDIDGVSEHKYDI